MRRIVGLASFLLLGGVPEAEARAQDCSGLAFLGSAVLVSGSAIYDIATAPASARRYNRTHLSIAPMVNPRRGSYGVMASWSFGRASRVPVPAAASYRSPATAFVLSAAATGIPMLAASTGTDAGWQLFLGGIIIGPSVGHMYAGRVGRGVGTIVLRGAVTAVGLYSIVGCFTD